jgi:Ni/Co efflux regulator RcnB
MRVKTLVDRFTRTALVAVLLVGVGMAQGNSGHDRDEHGRGNDKHEGDKHEGDKHEGDHDNGNRGNYQQRGNSGHDSDYRFRDGDRQNFQSYYSKDVHRWQQRPQGRLQFSRGQRIPDNYQFQVVPQAYYRNVPPPPPGYRYGYRDGYVVAYSPTTRIIADVLDLVTAVNR